MNNGWEVSAQAWVDSIGERGDWGREHVLDPVMMGRITGPLFQAGAGRWLRRGPLLPRAQGRRH